jgi:hypothetical protein
LIDAVIINSANQFGLLLWTVDRKTLGYLGGEEWATVEMHHFLLMCGQFTELNILKVIET